MATKAKKSAKLQKGKKLEKTKPLTKVHDMPVTKPTDNASPNLFK